VRKEEKYRNAKKILHSVCIHPACSDITLVKNFEGSSCRAEGKSNHGYRAPIHPSGGVQCRKFYEGNTWPKIPTECHPMTREKKNFKYDRDVNEKWREQNVGEEEYLLQVPKQIRRKCLADSWKA
jgi:hypothetical protein